MSYLFESATDCPAVEVTYGTISPELFAALFGSK